VSATDLCFLTVAEAAKQIKAKKLSPVELAKAFLARIETIDPLVHSYILVTPEVALADAKAAESEIMAGRYRGPFHGIPYTVKDNLETKGIVTTGNSALFKEYVPTKDAFSVKLLKEAGGVLLGKAALRELALGVRHDTLPWPYPLNPWNRKYEFGGGSSTGSATAVSACLAMAALGTDTGGSVRNPSGFCGLAGMKPTYGRISRAGVIPNTFSLDSVGPMTWTVEDCALMLNVVSGFDPDDPGSQCEPVPDFTKDLGKGLKGLRIGVLRYFYENDLPKDDETRLAFEAAVKKLAELGAKVEDFEMRPLEEYTAVKVMLSNSEFYSVYEEDIRERPHLLGKKLRTRAAAGMMVNASDYIQAMRQRLKLAEHMRECFKNFDAMVTLTTIGPAPIDEPDRPTRTLQPPNLTMPFSISGLPAMSVPTGFDRNGLPLAMQIAGKAFDEATVFRVGHAYEQATTWHKQRPKLS
jgi:aspartyl-tRNA(Asn)/glutamyl-tRNA(Gln) amidotransferase subunit A